MDTMWNIIIIFTVTVIVDSGPYDVCTPTQWEGIQTLLTGTQEAATPTFIQTTARVSFDANNSRIAAFTSETQNSRHFQRDYLFLYDKKVVYIIEDGKCYAETLNTGFPPTCLPRSFNNTMARTWYGFPKTDAQLWLFGYEGIVGDLRYSIQLFMEKLILVTQQIRGNIENVPFFQTLEMVNSTVGIKNPDVFTLPSCCKTAELKGSFTTPLSMYGMFLPR